MNWQVGEIDRQLAAGGKAGAIPDDEVNRITADRVKQIARQILDKGKVSLAGIGPVGKLPDYDAIALRLKN